MFFEQIVQKNQYNMDVQYCTTYLICNDKEPVRREPTFRFQVWITDFYTLNINPESIEVFNYT